MGIPWLKNGKPVMKNGSPILCNECPCGEQPTDCSGKVQAYLEARYAELDPVSQMPVWSFVASYISDFSCSVWQEVSDSDSDSTNNEWTWLTPSSGNLLVAIPRLTTPYESVQRSGYVAYITATEIYNSSTGEHRVVGCKCSFDTNTYQCKQTFGVSEWSSIAGLCPVKKPKEIEQSTSGSESLPPIIEYQTSWVCDVETCDRLKLTLMAYQYWFGGCINGEGYIDWWINEPPEWWWQYDNFYNWEYYYGFNKHLMIWRFVQNGVWCYGKIPCPCEYIVSGTMEDGVMVHDMEGICDEMGECEIKLMLWVKHYTEQETSNSISTSESGTQGCKGTTEGVWEQIASAKGDYQCAVWERNGNDWTLVSPSSGNLVVAYTRSASGKPQLSPEAMAYDYAHFVSVYNFYIATTLRNKETGAYKTLGCQCYADTTNRQCQTVLRDIDGICIGGKLSARQDEYRYGICDIDICAAMENYFPIMAQWYGGEVIGECIVDEVNEQNTSAEWSYSPFKKAYKWSEQVDSSSSSSGSDSTSETKWAIMMECNCQQYSMTDSFWLAATEINDAHRLCPASGVCNAECQKLVALKASASERGWTDHGSGVIRHKRSRVVNNVVEVLPYLDLFSKDNDLGDYNGASLVIVESPNAFYGIGCGCEPSDPNSLYKAYGINKSTFVRWDMPEYYGQTAPDGYWHFLPWNIEDGCSCIDNRKFALDYPDLFGIDDISYGTNTTYAVTASGPVPTFSHPIVQCYTGGNSYYNRFVDFRTMCMIINTFDNKQQLNWISPAGSPFQSNTNQYTSGTPYYAIYYDTITFTGHCPLFSRFTYEHPLTHAQSNYYFTGYVMCYTGVTGLCDSSDPCNWDMGRTGCITQEYEGKSPYQQASEYASSSCHFDRGWRSTYDWSNRIYPFVDWNNNECEMQQGRVESCTSSMGQGYEGYKALYYKGTCANVAVGENTEKMPLIYWLQYIQTNKGIAVNGLSGFQPSVTRKEAGDHQTFCNASTDFSSYHDTTINATLVDEDMHWCSGNEPEDWSNSASD